MPSLRQTMIDTVVTTLINLDFSYKRTDNASHTIIPSSLGIPARLNNTEMPVWLATNIPGLTRYESVTQDEFPLVVDEVNRLVVVHTKGSGDSVIGPYNNEYLWIFKTTKDGKLVSQSWEFIDSVLFTEYAEGLE